MSYRLYLDDLRTPIDESFVVVRGFEAACEIVLSRGVPSFISFDHDLGADKNGWLLPTGYDFAKWLVSSDMDGTISIPDNFSFKVHSQNPVGAKNIQAYMDNYLNFKKTNNQTKTCPPK